MRLWTPRQWVTAAVASVVVALLIGLPTDVIPNPVFGRPVDITWWSYPTLLVTAMLGGLLAATYVRVSLTEGDDERDDLDRPGRLGGIGGVLSFFAVGCPVCNKLVVIAVGTTGALEWFAPAQPLLAVASIALLAWALRTRLRNAASCRVSGTIREDRDQPAMMSE
ncbi:MAG: hypothetical protein ACO3VI_06140 [Ilumatobacteraceae bacterium]